MPKKSERYESVSHTQVEHETDNRGKLLGNGGLKVPNGVYGHRIGLQQKQYHGNVAASWQCLPLRRGDGPSKDAQLQRRRDVHWQAQVQSRKKGEETGILVPHCD
jgi:hypothetical protein